MSITLTLDLRDHAGVDALIAAQQDPDSPLYHQWIAPEEFQARFGPTANDLKDVKDFLAAEGFGNVTQVTSTQIAAEGTVALVESALQVQINEYAYDGRRVFANDRAPVLPPELASKIVHVGGLDDLTVMKPSHGPTTPVDEGYVLTGQNFMLARDSQVSYGQKAGYFDVGKKGNSGAEMAIASSFNVNVSDVNDQLTRQGGGGAGYNTLVAAASGAHSIQVFCIPGTGAGTGCTFVNNGGATADSLETNWDLSLASSIANETTSASTSRRRRPLRPSAWNTSTSPTARGRSRWSPTPGGAASPCRIPRSSRPTRTRSPRPRRAARRGSSPRGIPAATAATAPAASILTSAIRRPRPT
jgi:hypothetical protein